MKTRWRKATALALALVYCATNVVLNSFAESNIWAERSKAQQRPQPMQLAALPSLFSPAAPVSLQRINFSIPKNCQTTLFPILKALPQNAGTIRKITSPNKNGRVVIHIQDVHRNPEAQANISKAVQELIDAKKVDLVALEGAFGPMDFSWYRRYPYQDSVKAVADYLLKEKRISGPVYAAFRSPTEIPIYVGVDQKQHYDANVEAYRAAAPLVARYKKVLEKETRELNDAKTKTFNVRLKNFDDQVQAYRHGTLSWGDYVRDLAKVSSPCPLNGEARRGINAFLTTLEMEEHLNFERVETERTHLIAELVRKLNKTENDELLNRGVAFRSGEITTSDFYAYLKELCSHKNVDLRRFPSMDEYIRYVLLSESLDVDGILKEAASAEKGIYSTLAKTDEERRLVASSRYFHLVGKLLDFALTKGEWEEYRRITNHKAQNPNEVQNSNEQNSKNLKLTPLEFPLDFGLCDLDLSAFDRFYLEAEARDEAMSANLQKAMDSSHAKVAVLVTGGFHSEGMLRQLQPKGFTVVSYVPKISKIEDANGSAYLSVFTQEKTPLDKLFAGEKLFLTPPVMVPDAIGHPTVNIVAAELRHPTPEHSITTNQIGDTVQGAEPIDPSHILRVTMQAGAISDVQVTSEEIEKWNISDLLNKWAGIIDKWGNGTAGTPAWIWEWLCVAPRTAVAFFGPLACTIVMAVGYAYWSERSFFLIGLYAAAHIKVFESDKQGRLKSVWVRSLGWAQGTRAVFFGFFAGAASWIPFYINQPDSFIGYLIAIGLGGFLHAAMNHQNTIMAVGQQRSNRRHVRNLTFAYTSAALIAWINSIAGVTPMNVLRTGLIALAVAVLLFLHWPGNAGRYRLSGTALGVRGVRQLSGINGTVFALPMIFHVLKVPGFESVFVDPKIFFFGALPILLFKFRLGTLALRLIRDRNSPVVLMGMKSASTLVEEGPYRFVRHPAYSQYPWVTFAVVLINPVWAQALAGLLWWIAIELSARKEERDLLSAFANKKNKTNSTYRSYMERVPSRFSRAAYVAVALLAATLIASLIDPGWLDHLTKKTGTLFSVMDFSFVAEIFDFGSLRQLLAVVVGVAFATCAGYLKVGTGPHGAGDDSNTRGQLDPIPTVSPAAAQFLLRDENVIRGSHLTLTPVTKEFWAQKKSGLIALVSLIRSQYTPEEKWEIIYNRLVGGDPQTFFGYCVLDSLGSPVALSIVYRPIDVHDPVYPDAKSSGVAVREDFRRTLVTAWVFFRTLLQAFTGGISIVKGNVTFLDGKPSNAFALYKWLGARVSNEREFLEIPKSGLAHLQLEADVQQAIKKNKGSDLDNRHFESKAQREGWAPSVLIITFLAFSLVRADGNLLSTVSYFALMGMAAWFAMSCGTLAMTKNSRRNEESIAYGLKSGSLNSELASMKEDLRTYLSRNGFSSHDSEKLANTLVRMGDGVRSLVETWGVLTSEEAEAIKANTGQKKILNTPDLALRLRHLLNEYAGGIREKRTIRHFNSAERDSLLKRLVPIEVLERELDKGVPWSSLVAITTRRFALFPKMDEAIQFVERNKDTVGGSAKAWAILTSYGLEKSDAWVVKAKVFVVAHTEMVGRADVAWGIVIAHGLEGGTTWAAKAKEFVDDHQSEVGGFHNAWRIVLSQGLEKSQDWLDQAKQFVEAQKDTVGGTTNAWSIVINYGLEKSQSWMVAAKQFVEVNKETTVGAGNAWRIVIGQGLEQAGAWMINAQKFVEAHQDEVGGPSNAWDIVVSQGLEKAPAWVVLAKKFVEAHKENVGGAGHAWFIVIYQGLKNAETWVGHAKKFVEANKETVGGAQNAWNIVIAQGLPLLPEDVGTGSHGVPPASLLGQHWIFSTILSPISEELARGAAYYWGGWLGFNVFLIVFLILHYWKYARVFAEEYASKHDGRAPPLWEVLRHTQSVPLMVSAVSSLVFSFVPFDYRSPMFGQSAVFINIFQHALVNVLNCVFGNRFSPASVVDPSSRGQVATSDTVNPQDLISDVNSVLPPVVPLQVGWLDGRNPVLVLDADSHEDISVEKKQMEKINKMIHRLGENQVFYILANQNIEQKLKDQFGRDERVRVVGIRGGFYQERDGFRVLKTEQLAQGISELQKNYSDVQLSNLQVIIRADARFDKMTDEVERLLGLLKLSFGDADLVDSAFSLKDFLEHYRERMVSA